LDRSKFGAGLPCLATCFKRDIDIQTKSSHEPNKVCIFFGYCVSLIRSEKKPIEKGTFLDTE